MAVAKALCMFALNFWAHPSILPGSITRFAGTTLGLVTWALWCIPGDLEKEQKNNQAPDEKLKKKKTKKQQHPKPPTTWEKQLEFDV